MVAPKGRAGRSLAEHLMIKSLLMLNFRCFKHLELDSFARVNIVVGRNGSGKTSLLEGIYLAAGGSPDTALKLRRWRGFGIGAQVAATRTGYESLWRDLFFNFSPESGAALEIVGDPSETTRKLYLQYRQDEERSLDLGKDPVADSAIMTPLTFAHTDENGNVVHSRILVDEGKFVVRPPVRPPVLAAFFNSISLFDGPAEPATQLSALRQRNRADGLLRAVRAVYPSIESLSVEVISGVPMICGLIQPLDQLQPIALGSAGMTKLLHILLGIASVPKGVVLIDEIENGFYWETLPLVWATVLDVAKEYETQVFASTHSMECLRALEPSLEINAGAFRLLRMTKDAAAIEPTVKPIKGNALAAAITEGFEVR